MESSTGFGANGGITWIAGKAYIQCDGSNYYSCDDFIEGTELSLAGNRRTECLTNLLPNVTLNSSIQVKVNGGLCRCKPDCFEARCIAGPDGCLGLGGLGLFKTIILTLYSVASLCIVGLCIKLILDLSKKGNFKINNAVGSTLIVATIAQVICMLWTLDGAIILASGSSIYGQVVSAPILTPLAGFFNIVAYFNISLMWVQVAQSSKSLKKTGANLGKKPLIFVITNATIFGLGLILFNSVFYNQLVGAALALVFSIIVLMTYIIGGRELALALGGGAEGAKSPKVQLVIRTSRRMSIGVTVFIVAFICNVPTRLGNLKSAAWRPAVYVLTYDILAKGAVWVTQLIGVLYISEATRGQRGMKARVGTSASTGKGSSTTVGGTTATNA
eukprot:g6643.t1